MNHSSQTGVVLTSLMAGLMLVSGCSTALEQAQAPQVTSGGAPIPATALPETLSQQQGQLDLASSKQPKVKAKAQLIKTATLALRVQDVEAISRQVTTVVTAQGGDLLELQDRVPDNASERRTATFKLRVPQANLEATLTALAKLGTIETRSIQAEDVSTQLVDSEARLRNLRKSEGVVLGIMERSGSVGDVLKVSQELSNIRNQIEQIQAQVNNLKGQVAFSTITLSLTAAIAEGQQEPPLGDRLQETWSQSTHALGETTSALLRLILWLLVFSPYWLVGAGLIWLIRKRFSQAKKT